MPANLWNLHPPAWWPQGWWPFIQAATGDRYFLTGGEFKQISEIYVMSGGSWKLASEMHVLKLGSWVEVQP